MSTNSLPQPKARLTGLFLLGYLICLGGAWWHELLLLDAHQLTASQLVMSTPQRFLARALQMSWLLFLLGGAVGLRFHQRLRAWAPLAGIWVLLALAITWLQRGAAIGLQQLAPTIPVFQRIHVIGQELILSQTAILTTRVHLAWMALWLGWLVFLSTPREGAASFRMSSGPLWTLRRLRVLSLFLLAGIGLWLVPLWQILRINHVLLRPQGGYGWVLLCIVQVCLLGALGWPRPSPTQTTLSPLQDPPSPSGDPQDARIHSAYGIRFFLALAACWMTTQVGWDAVSWTWHHEIIQQLAQHAQSQGLEVQQKLSMLDYALAWQKGMLAGMILLLCLCAWSRRDVLLSALRQRALSGLAVLLGSVLVYSLLHQPNQHIHKIFHRIAAQHQQLRPVYERLSLPRSKALYQEIHTLPPYWLLPPDQSRLVRHFSPPRKSAHAHQLSQKSAHTQLALAAHRRYRVAQLLRALRAHIARSLPSPSKIQRNQTPGATLPFRLWLAPTRTSLHASTDPPPRDPFLRDLWLASRAPFPGELSFFFHDSPQPSPGPSKSTPKTKHRGHILLWLTHQQLTIQWSTSPPSVLASPTSPTTQPHTSAPTTRPPHARTQFPKTRASVRFVKHCKFNDAPTEQLFRCARRILRLLPRQDVWFLLTHKAAQRWDIESLLQMLQPTPASLRQPPKEATRYHLWLRKQL